MTQLVNRVIQALVWLFQNAAGLDVSADRINLSGHSAGGHLTAMCLTTHWQDLDPGLPADLIKTVIPLSGLYQLEPLLHTTISDALQLSADEVLQLSPCYLRPTTNAPVLAIVGGAETPEFFRQTDELIEHWSETGQQMEKFVEPDVDHFDLVERFAATDSTLFKRVISWLR